MEDYLVRRGSEQELRETHRSGLRERRLLTLEGSHHQNVLLLEAEGGMEVELHTVHTSESLYILEGTFEVFSAASRTTLGPGDLVYFPPSSSHGMRCINGPGRYLTIFAPPIE